MKNIGQSDEKLDDQFVGDIEFYGHCDATRIDCSCKLNAILKLFEVFC